MAKDRPPLEEAKDILARGIEGWHSFSGKQRKALLSNALEELEKLD